MPSPEAKLSPAFVSMFLARPVPREPLIDKFYYKMLIKRPPPWLRPKITAKEYLALGDGIIKNIPNDNNKLSNQYKGTMYCLIKPEVFFQVCFISILLYFL